MKCNQVITKTFAIAAISVTLSFATGPASAHCDGVDGPVVKAAQQALDTGNVNRALIWVRHTDEAQITDAFRKTLDVRTLNPAAREMADNYFFETVVRVHRAGEGAPYTGIKPAGRDLGPAIPAGDKAVETGSMEAVAKLLTDAVHKGLHEQFEAVMSKKNFSENDVAAGRGLIEAYVKYIHYVEGVYDATQELAERHHSEPMSHAHMD